MTRLEGLVYDQAYSKTHFLSVNHADLANKRADVDEKIEIHIDACSSEEGVDNDTFAAPSVSYEEFGLGVLLSDKGRDVCLECTSPEPHDDNCQGKDADGTVGFLDDSRNRRDDEQDVSEEGDGHGDANRLVTAPSGVSYVCPKERNDINPVWIPKR